MAIWAVGIGLFDGFTARIPNLALLVVAVPAVWVLILGGRGLLGADVSSSLLGFGIGAALTWAAYAARMLGAGDVKLAALLGLLLGFEALLWMLLGAALLLGIVSACVAVRARSRPGLMKRRIPAGPALAGGFLLALIQMSGRTLPGLGIQT